MSAPEHIERATALLAELEQTQQNDPDVEGTFQLLYGHAMLAQAEILMEIAARFRPEPVVVDSGPKVCGHPYGEDRACVLDFDHTDQHQFGFLS